MSRGRHSSSFTHTSVPYESWSLVQTGCREEAFQGRGAELGKYIAHPPIPTCKTLPGDLLAQASENRLVCTQIMSEKLSL